MGSSSGNPTPVPTVRRDKERSFLWLKDLLKGPEGS